MGRRRSFLLLIASIDSLLLAENLLIKEEKNNKLFFVSAGDRKRSNNPELQRGRFESDAQKNVLVPRIEKRWNKFPVEVATRPVVDVFWKRLGEHPSEML